MEYWPWTKKDHEKNSPWKERPLKERPWKKIEKNLEKKVKKNDHKKEKIMEKK